MKKKLKHIEVKIPVFKSGIHYIVDCDFKELNRYCKKKFELGLDHNFDSLKSADGAFLTLEGENAIERIVWVEKFSMSHSRLGVLVHETTHAVVRLLEHKGIPYSSENNQDETFAYLMDYAISNFIHRYKNK